MGGLARLYVACLSLGALCLFPVHDVLAFTSISQQQSSPCLSCQRLVSPTSCENAASAATPTSASCYALATPNEGGVHSDKSYQNDAQETSAGSATAAEVSRRSALTTLTALALGGRALARKPEPSAATSTASIAAAKSIKEGAVVGATALQSRPPATKKGLAATATLAAGWGSSVDMPTYSPTGKARGLIAAAKAKAKATAATSPIAINPLPNLEASASGIGRSIKARVRNGMGRSRRIARAFVRVAEVIALALPAAILYPVVAIARKYRPNANWTQRVFELWLGVCIHSTERGGAVLIKLSQWAASRPDVFGVEFADKFKKLQDNTTPHKWEHTEKCLSEAYGKNWRDHLRIEEDNILGSGCIAQVYKGWVTNEEGKEQPVAIKVAHPRVRNTIEKDLGIMRYLAKSMERLPFGWGEKLKWNNLSGGVEEFATMLEPQLDLRNEANHIDRFNKDFAKQPDVIFPELVEGYEASRDVLVETFCSGVTLEDFCEQHKDDVELRARMCELGARTMCEMIFNNNFVHSDVSAILCALRLKRRQCHKCI